MKQEDKLLLLKDLSARIPYGVIVAYRLNRDNVRGIVLDIDRFGNSYIQHHGILKIDEILPILRPMSSMTKEEDKEYMQSLGILELIHGRDAYEDYVPPFTYWKVGTIDFFNAHHFDYRGLIKKGLAIEVTEENNPYK